MKKAIIVIFFVLVIGSLHSNDLLNDIIYNGNLSVLDNLIVPQQLMNFSPAELRLLRNTIYARHNYLFESYDLQEFFSQFLWYNGMERDVEHSLSYIDHRNVRTIKILEEHYPEFISLNDERLSNPDYQFVNMRIRNRLIISGWRNNNRLLSKIINWYSGTRDPELDRFIEWWRKIAEDVSNDISFSSIEEYTLYARRIPTDDGNDYWYNFEIGLNNNLDNSSVLLGNTGWEVGYQRERDEPLTENDIWYLGLRSPVDEQIIALIVIIPKYVGGDRDGPRTGYHIFYIDFNEL